MTPPRTAWREAVSPLIEREYNLRAAFPDYVDYFEGWRRHSAAVRRDLKCRLDVPYGEGPRERLDLFDANARPAPLLVFVHGGYWRSMDKSDFSFIAVPFVERGISVAMLNYDLCPAAPISKLVAQVRAACLWLARNTALLGVRPGGLNLAGWSAGAHLIAMMAATDWPREADGKSACAVASALAISGIYDLQPVRQTSVNEDLRLDDVEAQNNSPLYLAPDPAARIAIAWGAGETSAFRTQSRDFADRWKTKTAAMTTAEIPGAHHYSVLSLLGEPSGEIARLALDLVENQ